MVTSSKFQWIILLLKTPSHPERIIEECHLHFQ